MDKNGYDFKTLEGKYGGFLGPAVKIKVGDTEVDSSKVPITSLTVEIDAGKSAGGCSFVIESMYDYENSVWTGEILNTIEIGAKIEIEAGYVEKKRVFYGFVDDYSIEYTSNGAPSLSVSGIDAKGSLMNNAEQDYKEEESTKDVIEAVLKKCKTNNSAESFTVGSLVDIKYDAQLIKDEMTDYAFLNELAELFNMQFFVVNGEIIFDNLMSDTKVLISLTLGMSLISFKKTISTKDQISKFIVRGYDPLTNEPISGEADSTSISGPEGEEAKDKAGEIVGAVKEERNYFVTTADEAANLAQSRFDAAAFGVVKGTGKCLGIPEIIPGRYIEINGLDDKSDNIYFVTKVTHQYSGEEGYSTSFEVKGAVTK